MQFQKRGQPSPYRGQCANVGPVNLFQDRGNELFCAAAAISAPEHACRYDHKTPATLVRQRLMPQPGPVCAPEMHRMSGIGGSLTRLRAKTM